MIVYIKNMRLASQLRGSFFFLLVLLAVVAGFSLYGFTKSQQGFVDYRQLAIETNLAGRLQANLLYTRLNVLKYIKEDDPETLKEYTRRLDLVEQFLREIKTASGEPGRLRLIDESVNLTQEYKSNFAKVVGLLKDRNKIVFDELDPAGKAMRISISALFNQISKNTDYEDAHLLSQVQESLLLGRLYVTKFLVSNKHSDIERAEQELAKTSPYIDKLLKGTLNTDSSLENVKTNLAKYLNALKNIEQTIITRNDIINNKLNKIGPSIADNLESVKLSVKNEQDELGPKVQKNSEMMIYIVKIVSISALFLGLLFAVTLPKMIRRPIGGEPKEIAAVTERIAKGDLTEKFEHQEDATGIFKSIIYMSNSLKSVISRIVTNGDSISEAAITSSQIAQNTNNVVNEQRERTSQIATAINEMAYSIQEVVKLSTNSASSANEAKKAAETGLTVIDSTVGAINRLAETIENAMKDINKLEQSSHDIGAVVEVIRNISEQTNLLALNAAIEAARAGEQGRGFSVVADEVRNLAQRTQESTNEIQTMIEALQAGTNTAVSSMSTSSDEAHRTVELSGQTRQQLDGILSMISDINDMNNQVAVAVEEQSTVCEDINQNITGISESSDASSQSATEAAMASEKMAELAHALQMIAKEFKIS